MTSSRLILGVLAIILAISLIGANVAVGLDRGVLDDEHVSSELDDTDMYERIHSIILEELEGELPDPPDQLPGDIQVSGIVEETFTVEYIRDVFEGNIKNLYAFLHGDTDTVELIIEVDPLIENFEAAVSQQIADLPLSELGIEEMTVPVEDDSVTINPAMLDEGITAYEDEINGFEDAVREILSDQYEAQTGEEPSDEQVDEMYEELREDLKAELNEAIDATIADADLPAELEDAATAIGSTITDAYMTEMTHDDFEERHSANMEALGLAGATFAVSEIGDFFEEPIDLGENVEEDDLSPIVSAVSWIGTLAILLPFIVLGIIGVMYGMTRDVVSVAKVTGGVAIVIGVLMMIITFIIPSTIENLLHGSLEGTEMADELTEVVPDLVAIVFDPILIQSAAILALGVMLVGAGFVSERYPSSDGVEDEASAVLKEGEADADERGSSDDGSVSTPDERSDEQPSA